MNFENVAFLFDSTILGVESERSVHGVVSFVGNPLYISAYARDVVDKFDFSGDNANELKSWLSIPQNEAAFASFMIKIYGDVSILVLLTYFIEKDYSAFIYLIELVYSINTISTYFHHSIEVLYRAYKSKYDDVIVRNSIDDTIITFNERIKHIIQTQRGNHSFQNLRKEGCRTLNDQLTIAHLINQEKHEDFMLTDNLFYSKQIIGAFKEKGVHEVLTTKNTACRFKEAKGHLFKSADVTVCEGNPDDDFENIQRFARIVMMCSHYFIEKIIEVNDISMFSEEDKYLFVLIWMVLQSGDSNLFINSHSYEHINELFLSLKKDMDA